VPCFALVGLQLGQDGTKHEQRLLAAPGLTMDALRGGSITIHQHVDADFSGRGPLRGSRPCLCCIQMLQCVALNMLLWVITVAAAVMYPVQLLSPSVITTRTMCCATAW
jgi:hypothetical protein